MSPRGTKISLSLTSVIMVVCVLAIAYGIWQMWSIVLLIATAIVIASFVTGITRSVTARPVARVFAVLGVYLFIFAVLGGLMYLFIPAFLHEALQLAQHLPKQLGSWTKTLDIVKGFANISADGDIVASIQTSFTKLSDAGVFQLLSAAFGNIANLIIVFVLSFYLSIEDRGIERFIRSVTPIRHEMYALSLWRRVEQKISSWFRGQLMTATILAILTYIGLSILGVPYAFMLSLLALVMGLVPFGIALAGLISIGVAYLYGDIQTAIWVLVMYVVLQQLENQVLQPLIIRKLTGVPAAVILIALVVAGSLWGFLGVILAIPLAVTIMELIRDHESRKQVELDQLCDTLMYETPEKHDDEASLFVADDFPRNPLSESEEIK